jgi:hypothetical protein
MDTDPHLPKPWGGGGVTVSASDNSQYVTPYTNHVTNVHQTLAEGANALVGSLLCVSDA